LSGGAYQSIYHFTMGGQCEDDRILDRAPYDHLKGRAHASIDPNAAEFLPPAAVGGDPSRIC